MKVLIFGFKNSLRHIISNLDDNFDKIYINSNISSIKKFVTDTNFKQYDYVIGLGLYSGKDTGYIRIETKCSSQFRNNKSNLELILIPYFFKPDNNFKLASGIGNSLCNLVTYSVLKKSHNIKYTFLHIPKTFCLLKATDCISNQLKVLQPTNKNTL